MVIAEVAITAIKHSVFTEISRHNTIELRCLSQLYIRVTETNIALSVIENFKRNKNNFELSSFLSFCDSTVLLKTD